MGPNIARILYRNPLKVLLVGTLAGVWDTESLEALLVPRVEPYIEPFRV